MSEVQESGGRGRSRSRNIELNLVPVIDLMSVLITFLLLSAVWTQISLIQMGSSVYGKRNFDPTQQMTPEDDVALRIDVAKDGYLVVMGKESLKIPLRLGVYDEAGLIETLKRFKESYPQKTSAAIAISDDLPYERLIKAMDASIAGGFPTIDVLTGGP